MKRILTSLLTLIAVIGAWAADTVYVKSPQIPVLIERQDNVLFYMRMNAKETKQLNSLTVNFSPEVPLSQIKALKLYYSGTEALQDRPKRRCAPVEYISSNNVLNTLSANPS